MPEELQISPDGNYLWDGAQWISVEHVPLRVFGHVPGARLSHDDNFWWNHVANRWERVADARAAAVPPSGPPAARNPVTSTTSDLEEPPTVEHMQWGRAVVDDVLRGLVGPVSELAEKVLRLGGTPDEILKVLEKGGEGVHALEMFEIGGEAMFGGAAAAAIIVPFAMWYEAIQANYAGDLHRLRWQIYNPWMNGFIGGLYNTSLGENPLFATWQQGAHAFTSGLDDSGKRAVTGALIATYAYNLSTTTVNAKLTHEQWDMRLDWRHGYRGLEIALSGVDS
jgi:hypothetical protein